jgi:hypothetical protein
MKNKRDMEGNGPYLARGNILAFVGGTGRNQKKSESE